MLYGGLILVRAARADELPIERIYDRAESPRLPFVRIVYGASSRGRYVLLLFSIMRRDEPEMAAGRRRKRRANKNTRRRRPIYLVRLPIASGGPPTSIRLAILTRANISMPLPRCAIRRYFNAYYTRNASEITTTRCTVSWTRRRARAEPQRIIYLRV